MLPVILSYLISLLQQFMSLIRTLYMNILMFDATVVTMHVSLQLKVYHDIFDDDILGDNIHLELLIFYSL